MDLVKVSTVRLSIKIGDGDGEFHLVLLCLFEVDADSCTLDGI